MMSFLVSRSVWLSTVGCVILLFLIFGSVVPASGLKCIQCGMYNDGVGSITPCLNYTIGVHLKECPSGTNECIKYVNAGTTVRECAPGKCVEKRSDSWSTSVYCCSEEGCNAATNTTISLVLVCAITIISRLFAY